MSDNDPEDFDEFEELDGESLDDHEAALIQQEIVDLGNFEATFRTEGYRGVSIFCHDCVEEHYFPWDMLRENLTTLLETGETPVHEPAFEPDPEQYIPWDYARGYVDALQDAGVHERVDLDRCPRCGLDLPGAMAQGNFCPRCGTALVEARLRRVLADRGMDEDEVDKLLREVGLPS